MPLNRITLPYLFFASVLVFILASLGFFAFGNRATQQGHDVQGQTHTGEIVRLSELPGDLRLIYFGYMNCPDVCLDAALSIGSALKNLSAIDAEARAAVTNVFITLDPADDVIEGPYNELAGYLDSRYGGQGVAIRPADAADARAMARAFGLKFAYVADDFFPLGYRVDHASLIFLTDKAGQILAFYPDRTPGRQIAQEVLDYL